MEIKILRTRANLTQGQLAEKLGVDRSTVAYWDANAAYPRAELLPRIADALGCSIDALFGRDSAAQV